MNGTIYMYTCPNDKSYIGQTWVSLKQRSGYNGIGYRNCPAFYPAIKKYGWEALKLKVLHTDITSQDELDRLEHLEIANHNTIVPNGYNLKHGGHGSRHSQLTIDTISNIKSEFYKNPIHREQQSIQKKGYWDKHPESRERMSKWSKQWHKDNPHFNSCKEKNQKKSASLKLWNRNNSQTKKTIEKRVRSVAQWRHNNPEKAKALSLKHSQRMRDRMKDPAFRDKLRLLREKKRLEHAIEAGQLFFTFFSSD